MLFADIDLMGIAACIAAIGSAVSAVYSARAKWATDLNAIELSHVKSNVTDVRETIITVKEEGARMAADIHQVELATNSMKDALVSAAQRAGELKGRQDQKAESDANERK